MSRMKRLMLATVLVWFALAGAVAPAFAAQPGPGEATSSTCIQSSSSGWQ
jgi:hypothetical protein